MVAGGNLFYAGWAPGDPSEKEQFPSFDQIIKAGDVDEAVARCIRVVDVVEPDTELSRAYAELQPRFRALYPALRPFTGTSDPRN